MDLEHSFLVVLLHDTNFTLKLVDLASEAVHVRVVSGLEFIHLSSVAFSTFYLSLLEGQLFLLLLVSQGLISCGIGHHLLRVFVLTIFLLLTLFFSHVLDLALEGVFHLLLASKTLVISTSGLKLSVSMLLVQISKFILLIFQVHSVSVTLRGVFGLIELILESFNSGVKVLHFGFFSQNFFTEVSHLELTANASSGVSVFDLSDHHGTILRASEKEVIIVTDTHTFYCLTMSCYRVDFFHGNFPYFDRSRAVLSSNTGKEGLSSVDTLDLR
jgi:hypothetical protein